MNDFAFGASNRYYSHNDVAEIKTLGVKDNSFKGRAWFYNIASQYNVKSIELIDSSDKTYLVNLETVHSFRVGDNVALTGTDKIEKPISIISEIKSTKSFIVKGQGDLTTTDSYTVNRKLLKSISNTYPESSRFITNVQNTYKQGNDFLVASPSIPTYNSQPLNVSDQTIHLNGQFAAGGAWQITTTKDHGFYTGDAVYYTPEKVEETYVDSFGDTKKRVVTYTYLWDEGLYFVKRLDASRIRLAKSLTCLLYTSPSPRDS